MKNNILRIIGWLLCIPAILLGPVARKTYDNINKPWVDGLLVNMWRAYAKYDTKSWIRRMIGIYKNPNLTIQYLNILRNKQIVYYCGATVVNTSKLQNMHDTQTDHAHHRERVKCVIEGGKPKSKYGPMIVTDNIVHDGNHRLAAYHEAGNKNIVVELWKSI